MSVFVPTGDAAVMPRFPVLDTLRAVGAIAVLTTHVAFWGGDYSRHGAWGTLLARFDVGVALFFVLSGFLLSYPFLARARDGQRAPHARPYLWKRFLRIYPVYVVTVVLALTLIPANHGRSPADWVATLLISDSYVHQQLPDGLTQMWTLGVETAFYLALPLLMLAATGRSRGLRTRRVTTVLAVMVATTVVWHLWAVDWLDGRVAGSPLLWVPGYLSWFAVGIGLALARVRHDAGVPPGRTRRLLTTLAALPGTCWALALGLLLLASTPLAGPTMLASTTAAQSLTKNLLYAAVGGLLVLPGVFSSGRGAFATVFSLPPLRHLGHISYSIFCLHLPILSLVMALTGYALFGGHGWQIWGLTMVLSLVAAEVAYRLVERPAMRLRRWGGQTERAAPPATAATTGTSTR